MAYRNTAALHVELAAIDRTERFAQSQALATEFRLLPRFQRAQYLGFERLVDLVKIEILEP